MANDDAPIDPAKLRARLRQIGSRQRSMHERLMELETQRSSLRGFPVAARWNPPKRPRTQDELEAVMIGNGATPEEAKRDAGQIFRNLYGETA